MSDGTPVIEGLPFATCNRCGQIVVLSEDGYSSDHMTPCGSHCELGAHPDKADTCSGWCSRCRTILTGCAGNPDRPCGRHGCAECGVHAMLEGEDGAACRNARSIARFAWTWDRVTCGGCLAQKPKTGD